MRALRPLLAPPCPTPATRPSGFPRAASPAGKRPPAVPLSIVCQEQGCRVALRPQSLPRAPSDRVRTSSEDALHKSWVRGIRGGGPRAGACGEGSRGCAAWAGRRFEGAWGRGSRDPYLPSSRCELGRGGGRQTTRRGREVKALVAGPHPSCPSPWAGRGRGGGGRRGPGGRPGLQSAPAGPGSHPVRAPPLRRRPASPPPRAPLPPPPLPWQPGASRRAPAGPPACGSARQRRRRRQLRLGRRALRPGSGAHSSPPARLRAPGTARDPAPAPARPPAPMELLAAAFSAACAVDHDSSTSESDARDSASGHLPGR